MEIWSSTGQYGAFMMIDEDGSLTKANDDRYIAWYTIFFDELVDRDWIAYDIIKEQQRCAFDRKYFYETYYRPVKCIKTIANN